MNKHAAKLNALVRRLPPEYVALVDSRLEQLNGVEAGFSTGRRLVVVRKHDDGTPYTEAETALALRADFLEFVDKVGAGIFALSPIVVIEQAVLMAAGMGHDLADTLINYVNSFLLTYGAPETSSKVYENSKDYQEALSKVSFLNRGILATKTTKH